MLLWWLAGTLRPHVRDAIADGAVAVSAVTVWEIEVKRVAGRLTSPDDLADQIAAAGFDPLPVTFAHAFTAAGLPRRHRDPFDRMLVAQAQVEGLTLVTRNRAIRQYDVAVLPA